MADKENSTPPGGTLVNYIYRCSTWWEVGKLTYMVAALPREKISCFFLSGVDRYGTSLWLHFAILYQVTIEDFPKKEIRFQPLPF